METEKISQKEIYEDWRKRIFISIWITYATFYLTRVNFSVAIPGIIQEYGISKTEIGAVLTALFLAYAFGQFVNGQLGDKFGARKLVTFGLIASGILNIIFGFNHAFTGMIIIWALNGYFQSMGWSPTVKTLANWFPTDRRGKMAGFLGTSYQIGNVFSWALAGFIVGMLGWRWAFFLPGIIVIISAIHYWIRVRNAPEEVGLPTIEEEENGIENVEKKDVKKDYHLGFRYTIGLVVKNPAIWAVALSLFALNIVRYGFLDWAPTYMFEVQKAAISIAAYKAMLFPAAGCIGALFAGWASEKFFKNRRAPVAAIMLFLLAIFAFIYPNIPVESWQLSLICLMAVGFMTYGPHVLIVTAMPMDFGTRKAAASATGFIDGMGYIGAALTGIAGGWLIDNLGWDYAFYFWVVGAIFAGILMLLLWNYKSKKSKYH